MAYYRKTEAKFQAASQSSNREKINEIFENFVIHNNETNFNFLFQRALKTFGTQVTTDMLEDQLQEIYLSMLLFPEEQLLGMEEIDLIKIFRSICNSPATVGNLFHKIKHADHLDLDDIDI